MRVRSRTLIFILTAWCLGIGSGSSASSLPQILAYFAKRAAACLAK